MWSHSAIPLCHFDFDSLASVNQSQLGLKENVAFKGLVKLSQLWRQFWLQCHGLTMLFHVNSFCCTFWFWLLSNGDSFKRRHGMCAVPMTFSFTLLLNTYKNGTSTLGGLVPFPDFPAILYLQPCCCCFCYLKPLEN